MSENALTDDAMMDEMLGDFLDESDEILGSLNENLLKLDVWVQSLTELGADTHCDDDLMNEMFRGAHSLKGLSGMLGLDNINKLVHKVENVFDAARNDKLVFTRDIVQLIFQSVDKLSTMIDGLSNSESCDVDCTEVKAGIDAALNAKPTGPVGQTDDGTNSNSHSAATPIALPPSGLDHFADIVDEDEVPAKYMAIFIDESESALDEVADMLMEEQNKDSTESLMIQCHKVKGSAASLGLNRATKLAHFMEDLLQELLQDKKLLSNDMCSAMLRCTDVLREFVESLKNGEKKTVGFNEAYAQLIASQTVIAEPQNGCTTIDDQKNVADENNSQSSQVDSEQSLSDDLRNEITSLAPNSPPSWIVRFGFDKATSLPGLKASLVYGRISNLGTVFFCDPPEPELEDLSERVQVTFGVSTEHGEELLRNKIAVQGIERLEFELLKSNASRQSTHTNKSQLADQQNSEANSPHPQANQEVSQQPELNQPVNQTTGAVQDSSPRDQSQTKPKVEKNKPAVESSKKPTETLRVDIERLDHLMNLAGQLVINKARFSQIGDGLKRLTASKQASNSLSSLFSVVDRLATDLHEEKQSQQPDMESLRSQARQIRADLELVQREVAQFTEARSMVTDLAEAVHQLDRVADGIQKTVMDTRMVPIGPLFRRFKRVIRDITHGNGKDIQLVIRGENTELDKRMIDELGDPLIHMIRNCADHGIESPEERESAGKPRQGTVTLNAYHRGNSILVSIKDDGKGLDAEKIRVKAISKGLITALEAEKLSNHQIYQLIWEPGLSTAEKVSEISGRGMGMDIVRTKIEDISGSVELESEVGVGTTISIKLPLTLAILPSLLVEIDGDVIAMPVESVSEIVRVNEEDFSSVHGMKTATVRGRVISVIQLGNLFSWNQPPKQRCEGVDIEEQSLVIIGSDGVEIGLIVDRLFGEEDIVIKSMAENYHNVYGIAGASILGDGRVSLILDVCAVLEMAATKDPIQKPDLELVQ